MSLPNCHLTKLSLPNCHYQIVITKLTLPKIRPVYIGSWPNIIHWKSNLKSYFSNFVVSLVKKFSESETKSTWNRILQGNNVKFFLHVHILNCVRYKSTWTILNSIFMFIFSIVSDISRPEQNHTFMFMFSIVSDISRPEQYWILYSCSCSQLYQI